MLSKIILKHYSAQQQSPASLRSSSPNPQNSFSHGKAWPSPHPQQMPHISVHPLRVYELAPSLSLVFLQLNRPRWELWRFLACFTPQTEQDAGTRHSPSLPLVQLLL